VGGAGKTPVVQYLAEMLIAEGKNVAIVHSGYGRRRNEDRIIGYGKAPGMSPDVVGDEVAMLAGAVPSAAFAVGRDKKQMLTDLDAEFKPDVAIIDDGYQRLDIEKDIDMALVPASFLIHGHDRMIRRMLHPFPRGILRERPNALERADMIGITGGEDEVSSVADTPWIREYGQGKPLVRWIFELAGAACEGHEISLDQLRKRRPYLFAGIGSYPRLLKMIRVANIPLVGEYSLGDHFDYDRLDIDMLARLGTTAGADCYLTTAKDVVKLPTDAFDKPLYCLRLAVRPAETDRLRDNIDRALA
jgi:tetraacyldisaccharide 4'-kinase